MYYAILVLIQFLFAINFIISKMILQSIPPNIFVFLRFSLSFFTFAAIIPFLKLPALNLSKRFWIESFIFSLLGITLTQLFVITGLKLTTTSNTAILTSSIPVLTSFILTLRGQNQINLTKLVGYFFALLGMVVIIGFDNLKFGSYYLHGNLLVILGCLCASCYFSFSKKYLTENHPFWCTLMLFMFASLQMLPWIFTELYEWPDQLIQNSYLWMLIFLCVILGSCLTNLLSNWVLSKISGEKVALFIYLQPVFSSVLAYILLGESLGLHHVLAFVFIFLGMYLVIQTAEK